MSDHVRDDVNTCIGGCRHLPGIIAELALSYLRVAAQRTATRPLSITDWCRPHPAVKAISALRLWDLLFQGCRAIGGELLDRKAAGGRHWLTHAELLELGPRTLVGLPALVLLRMALRGACAAWGRCPEQALLLCTGQLLTRENLPEAFVGEEAFGWMLEAQDALKTARVRPDDLPVLEGLALWEGDFGVVKVPAPGEDVEALEDLVMASYRVAAGSPGVVMAVSEDKQELVVQFGSHQVLVKAAQVQKLGGDRPKPLEALPSEADPRMDAMQAAMGRIRATALVLTSRPIYQKFFQSMVLTPLNNGTLPEPYRSDFHRTLTGRLVWRQKCGFGRQTAVC